MHPLLQRYVPRGTIRGGILFLGPEDAIDLLTEAERERVQVLGVDAFRITPSTTQPLLEHSIDYSREGNGPYNAWDAARTHVTERMSEGLVFEVVLDLD